MIDSGEAKNQVEMVKLKGISRARVTQILKLLKLDSLILQELEKFGGLFKVKIITERILRPYVNKSQQEQTALLNVLKTVLKV